MRPQRARDRSDRQRVIAAERQREATSRRVGEVGVGELAIDLRDVVGLVQLAIGIVGGRAVDRCELVVTFAKVDGPAEFLEREPAASVDERTSMSVSRPASTSC